MCAGRQGFSLSDLTDRYFNILTFTVKLASQAQHAEQTNLSWFLFSDVAQFFTYTLSLALKLLKKIINTASYFLYICI